MRGLPEPGGRRWNKEAAGLARGGGERPRARVAVWLSCCPAVLLSGCPADRLPATARSPVVQRRIEHRAGESFRSDSLLSPLEDVCHSGTPVPTAGRTRLSHSGGREPRRWGHCCPRRVPPTAPFPAGRGPREPAKLCPGPRSLGSRGLEQAAGADLTT